MTCTHANDAVCQKEAERMKKQLTLEMEAGGIYGISILGHRRHLFRSCAQISLATHPGAATPPTS